MAKRVAEQWPHWTGTIRVVTRDRRGRFTGSKTMKNLITNAGLNLMRDALGGYVTSAQINYVAIGTGSTAPAVTDVQLGSEQFRKAVTKQDNTVGTGQLKTTVYIGPSEGNITIAEVGWFVGGSSAPNSGVMIARVLYAHTHGSTESLQIDRTDTL